MANKNQMDTIVEEGREDGGEEDDVSESINETTDHRKGAAKSILQCFLLPEIEEFSHFLFLENREDVRQFAIDPAHIVLRSGMAAHALDYELELLVDKYGPSLPRFYGVWDEQHKMILAFDYMLRPIVNGEIEKLKYFVNVCGWKVTAADVQCAEKQRFERYHPSIETKEKRQHLLEYVKEQLQGGNLAKKGEESATKLVLK